jgi:hypothetical protein
MAGSSLAKTTDAILIALLKSFIKFPPRKVQVPGLRVLAEAAKPLQQTDVPASGFFDLDQFVGGISTDRFAFELNRLSGWQR